MFFRFTTTATNDRYGEDTVNEYIAAYGYEHAKQSIILRLEKAGWKVTKIQGYQISILDIRDSDDHTTDC